ncbi:MAG: hypothetical protein JO023_04500 [Chloroflexi bacterium]|nr:hypothetical protein [Chloroflexota bacterium]
MYPEAPFASPGPRELRHGKPSVNIAWIKSARPGAARTLRARIRQGAMGTKNALTSLRPRAIYTPMEQAFSVELCRRLEALLQGKCDRLDLVRKYPGEPERLGVIASTTTAAPDDRLRLSVAERLSFEVLRFVEARPVGGPVKQATGEDGSVLEWQTFPTRYADIVVERLDRYNRDQQVAAETTWRLRRIPYRSGGRQAGGLIEVGRLAVEVLGLLL